MTREPAIVVCVQDSKGGQNEEAAMEEVGGRDREEFTFPGEAGGGRGSRRG